MRKFGIALAFCFTFGMACNSISPQTYSLSGEEKKQAQSLAEQRQQIMFDKQAAKNEFQAKMNGLQQKENEINLESSRLCFALIKAHKLDQTIQYTLKEWEGQLVRR